MAVHQHDTEAEGVPRPSRCPKQRCLVAKWEPMSTPCRVEVAMEFPSHKEGQLNSRMLTSTVMILRHSGKLYLRRLVCVFLNLGYQPPLPHWFPLKHDRPLIVKEKSPGLTQFQLAFVALAAQFSRTTNGQVLLPGSARKAEQQHVCHVLPRRSLTSDMARGTF